MVFEKKIVKESIQINGNQLSLEVGRFAHQANAAVLARMGDTFVLATVVSSGRREDLDYFPLFVEYKEKLYAGGKIKGSRWVKREGRPSDELILTARLIDRSIRPLFPKGYKNEVQVVITVLSFDSENDPDILSICAASAALAISDIPWKGPIGAVRVGYKDKKFFVNPTYSEREYSNLDLIVSAREKAAVMVESGAEEVSEADMVAALKFAQKNIYQIVKLILGLKEKVGKEKQAFKEEKIDAELKKEILKNAGKQITDLVENFDKKDDLSQLDEIKKALCDKLEEYSKSDISQAVDKFLKDNVRERIFTKGKRIDGRKPDEIRPLDIEVAVLPRTHGSAVFQRGLTQALTITTLGSPSLEQWIESIEGEETKRYIHHYYMPPYSVGECGRFGWPSRREVGHGALAERALESVIPEEEKFPYTIRVVSEITSSNGSTSMAAVCGSSLSLMDAGVPIKQSVAGIAMGLMIKNSKSENKDYVVLTDITGLEDHIGDMDFKVAGTKDGITALQMDIKIDGVETKTLIEALDKAKKARLYILDQMKKILSAPRSSVSKHAPKVAVLQINKEKIGEVIGPGGRIIRKIISETGVTMDVNDEGKVTISCKDKSGLNRAINWVTGLTREVEIDEEFEGEVKRITSFGAFVEILPGKEGLVHVSQMSAGFVSRPEDVVQIGQKVKVRVREVDEMGRINLSMLFGEDARQVQRRQRSNIQQRRPRGFSPRRSNFRSDSRSNNRSNRSPYEKKRSY